jgi:hypothetical protein
VPVANIVLTALQRDFAPATLSHVSWILARTPWPQELRSCRGVPMCATIRGPSGASTAWALCWRADLVGRTRGSVQYEIPLAPCCGDT